MEISKVTLRGFIKETGIKQKLIKILHEYGVYITDYHQFLVDRYDSYNAFAITLKNETPVEVDNWMMVQNEEYHKYLNTLDEKKEDFRPNYETWKMYKNAYGRRWSAIILDSVKNHTPIYWTSLDDLYNYWSMKYGELMLPMKDYDRSERESISISKTDWLPHDGSKGYIRYTRKYIDNEQIYKKKIGSICREYLTQNSKFISPKAIDYLCERAASELQAFQLREANYTLKIDNDFEFIYSGDNDSGNLGSCQSGKELYYFYNLIKGAQAVSLLDENDLIICRAVLFNEIYDDDGNVYRGLERQYTCIGDNSYKELLVYKLKEKGLIDIYKDYNASAYDCLSWKRVADDCNFRERLHVNLTRSLDEYDTVAWMDSFYFYSVGAKQLGNMSSFGGVEIHNYDKNGTLCDCSGYPDRHYDEYLEEYVQCSEDDMHNVYFHGEDICVHESTRDNNFSWCDYLNEYHYEGDVVWSDYEDDYILDNDAEDALRPDGSIDTVLATHTVQTDEGDYVLIDEAISINGSYHSPTQGTFTINGITYTYKQEN